MGKDEGARIIYPWDKKKKKKGSEPINHLNICENLLYRTYGSFSLEIKIEVRNKHTIT